jgi:alkylated DNA nucleotide flippase Atl1
MPAKPRFTSRVSWREKLERVPEARVFEIPPPMQRQYGTGTMVIPKPLDVEALIRRVPKGKVMTLSDLRRTLAADAHADVACPLTTGIFLRLIAEAAEEERRQGKKQVTPYWRVVRDDGSLMEKWPGGAASQAEHLRAEGHTILPGKRPKLRMAATRERQPSCLRATSARPC